jgi:hypothetical protein
VVGDFKRRFPSLRSRLLSWQDVTVRLANDSDWPQWEALFREYRISQSPGTTGTTGTTRGFVWSIFTSKRNLRWFWCEKIWRSHRPYWTSMRIGFFLSANFRPDLCSKDSGRVTALHGWQDCNWRSCVAGFDAVVAQKPWKNATTEFCQHGQQCQVWALCADAPPPSSKHGWSGLNSMMDWREKYATNCVGISMDFL